MTCWLLHCLAIHPVAVRASPGQVTGQSAPIVAAGPYRTRNVIVVSIGGLRYTEAFGADNPSAVIPRMWNDLRPQGTLYRNVYNLGRTIVTAGNYSIVDGCLEVSESSMYYYRHLRPQFPTIFEYYRAAYPDIPVNKVWVVSGHRESAMVNYSSHPLFYDPSYAYPLPDPGHQYPHRFQASVDDRFNGEKADDKTWSELQLVLQQHHPSLVFVQLAGIDLAVEKGYGWSGYLTAITKADRVIGQLWDYVQHDPQYQDQTTLIVTASHGRDERLWEKVGGISDGCRHVFVLAVGPDIRQGTEIADFRQLTDICPTVGELMGFETPFSTGRVLAEMIQDYPPSFLQLQPVSTVDWVTERQLTDGPGMVTNPRIAAGGDQLHVVWAEQREGRTNIYYSMRPHRDADWTQGLRLSDSEIEARAPAIVATAQQVHVVWQEYRSGLWTILHRQRDSDGTWSPATVVASSILDDSITGQMAWEPAITLCGDQVLVGVPFLPSWLRVYRREFQGTWTATTIKDSSLATNDTLRRAAYQGIALTASGSQVHLLWQQVPRITWEMGQASSGNCGLVWSMALNPPSTSYGAHDVALAATDSQVYAAWIQLEHLDWSASQPMGLFRASAGLGGQLWVSPTHVRTLGARHPRMAAQDGLIALVWENYPYPCTNIQISYSRDAGREWQERVVTPGGHLVADPDVATNGQDIHVVWRDRRSGTWQLYVGTISQAEPSPTPSSTATPTATSTLSPTASSPTVTPSATRTATSTSSPAASSPTATPSATGTTTRIPTLDPSPSPAPAQVWLPVVVKR